MRTNRGIYEKIKNPSKEFVQEREIYKKVCCADKKSKLLRHIYLMRKNALTCGAYSTINIEKQNQRFDNCKVPDWERKIISNSHDATRKLAHELLMELDEISTLILSARAEK